VPSTSRIRSILSRLAYSPEKGSLEPTALQSSFALATNPSRGSWIRGSDA
jgi:hypothetical protein